MAGKERHTPSRLILIRLIRDEISRIFVIEMKISLKNVSLRQFLAKSSGPILPA
jgi:hypothetical protein